MLGKEVPFDWEALAKSWRETNPHALWRCYSDTLHSVLVQRWLVPAAGAAVLKTDLFDEAFGQGVYPELARRVPTVIGIDISQTVALQAKSHYPDLEVVGADVRVLPFNDAEFDVVISSSSLDHFESRAELDQSLAELYRVLRPGGELLITLDNAANPFVAVRNLLPYRWLQRLGLVP